MNTFMLPSFRPGQSQVSADLMQRFVNQVQALSKGAKNDVVYSGIHGVANRNSRPAKRQRVSPAEMSLARFKSYGTLPTINVRRGTLINGTFTEADQVDITCRCFVFGGPAVWSTVWPTLALNDVIPVASISGLTFCVLTFGDTC